MIYLDYNPNIEIDRIKKCNRDVEQSIRIDFLEMLNMKLIEVIKGVEIVRIDSNKYDFANNLMDKEKVLDKIRKGLNK